MAAPTTPYFTYKTQAEGARAPDMPSRVQFRAGKGYYVGYGKNLLPGNSVAPPVPHLGGQYQYPTGDPSNPFAPMSGHDITSAVNHLTGLYGAPLTEAQIGARAQGEIDPILAAITQTANTRATASSAAIKGLTDSYAGQLASTNYGAPYQQAEGQQAAVDAALTQQASGAGDSLAAGLKQNLASFGDDPSVAQAAAAQQSRGQNEATATLAGGSSALSNLIAQAAAASAYGQELPGIAKLAGIQGVEQANSQAANDIATGTQNTLATLPGILAAFRSDNANLQGNRASAAANVYETLTGQNLTKATAQAGLVNDQTSAAITAANDNVRNGIAQQNANSASTRASAAAAKAKAANGPKPLTPANKTKLEKAAEDLRFGVAPKQQFNSKTQTWMDVPNTGTPNSSYNEAYQALIAQGAPVKWARAQVNRLYKPGEFGRPMSAKQKAKTKQAVKGGRIGGTAMTPAQIIAQNNARKQGH